MKKAQQVCDEKKMECKEIQLKIDERDNDFRSLYDFERFNMAFYDDGIKLFAGRVPLNQNLSTPASPVKK